MTPPSPSPLLSLEQFEAFITEIRPELHRYATRMTGSAIDGEDVVQEALIKAHASFSLLTHNTNLRGWFFRITHNKAIDLLRHSSKQPLELLDEYPLAAEPDQPLEEKELATVALSMFLKLTPKQRSCVILKDVLGYSLVEISEMLDATVPVIKATLHRGRTRLRELVHTGEMSIPMLDEQERERLAFYVDRFNARDFEAVRAMLADEVQVDVLARAQMRGIEQVSKTYFHNYGKHDDWQIGLGIVENRLAILVYDPRVASDVPTYFMLLDWDNQHVARIRDYRYVRYVMQDASVNPL